jgi:hypothetical protein
MTTMKDDEINITIATELDNLINDMVSSANSKSSNKNIFTYEIEE